MKKQLAHQSPLSNEILLVLSFFLIGMITGRMIQAEMYLLGVIISFSGVVSFLVLDYSARRRNFQTNKTICNQQESQMQTRINKILMHESSASRPKLIRTSNISSIQQYVTVAQSSGK